MKHTTYLMNSKKSGFKSNHELVSDSMLHSLCIAGTPTECKKTTSKFS